jgi:hypothetical protein
VGHRFDVRVTGREHLAGLGEARRRGLVLVVPVDEGLNLGQRLRVRAVRRRIGLDAGVADEGQQFGVPDFDRFQFL